MKDTKLNYVTSKDGTKIAYEKRGQGPALILVGGGLNDRHASASGAPLAKQLKSTFTVYNYDRRGRGDSGNTLPYAIEREFEDIDALIQVAGGSTYLYGMSSGAILAIKATASGLNVKKLVVYEPPFTLDSTNLQEWHDYESSLTKLLDAGRKGEAVKLFMTYASMPTFLISAIRLTPLWKKAVALAPTLRYDAAVVNGRVLPKELLKNITIPVAVVDGGNSPEDMRATAKTLSQTLPNAEYHTLKGQTHNVNPRALAPVIKTFLEAGGRESPQ